MIIKLLIQTLLAFIACAAFAVIFNAPKKELVFCGLCGSIGWAVYYIITQSPNTEVTASFISAILVTIISRYLSHFRRQPSTIYLIPGVIPLVPGYGIYRTMYGILNQDPAYCFEMGVFTAKILGAIVIGIILILALPYSVFNFVKLKDND